MIPVRTDIENRQDCTIDMRANSEGLPSVEMD